MTVYIVNVDNDTIQAYDLVGNRVAARDVPVPDAYDADRLLGLYQRDGLASGPLWWGI